MSESKTTYWSRQIDGIAHELSKLAIACDIELGKPGLAERILKTQEPGSIPATSPAPDGPVFGRGTGHRATWPQ
jgi:hypothetical protein